ncbi:hypothetical protein RAS2_26440 [Phycisphaerae bacterium RAS2]|nr:hypothetical protein RAS2_26440 [Phycisphaerae bacterium RAS2]
MNKPPYLRIVLSIRRGIATAAILLIAVGTAGCPPRHGPGVSGTTAEPIARETGEIERVIRANGAKLNGALWSPSISVYAEFPDERAARRSYNLEGTLLFRAPRDLRIDLRPTLGDPVMGIGSNAEDYWLWIEPELHRMRWGRHVHAGMPCAGELPVRPDQLAAVLRPGLPDDRKLLGPIRTWGPNYDKLQYIRRGLGDGPVGEPWLVDREYWVERVEPYMVRQVVFRDAMGRIAVSARLDDYRAAWEGGPLLPHQVNVLWPRENAHFTLHADGWRPMAGEKVHARAFARPTNETLPAGVTSIEQIDALCESMSTSPTSRPAD